MQTYFSIVSTPLNTILNEKISVGLVMYNSEKSMLKFSYDKLGLIKGLISSSKYSFLKTYLKNIEVNINSTTPDGLFDFPKSKWINDSYMGYLNKYSNNSLIFSEPQKINLDLTESVFRNLFIKYIYDFDEAILNEKNTNIISEVKHRLYDKIESRVNLNVTVHPDDFSELITPVEVNFIGKNGVLVAGQTIDFNKKQYFLENDLSRFVAFTKAADYQKSINDKGTYFVIGQEPSRQSIQHHITWKHVKESKLVKYVDLSEIDSINEYIINKDVHPLYKKQASN